MLEHYLKVQGPIGHKMTKFCGVCTDVTDEINHIIKVSKSVNDKAQFKTDQARAMLAENDRFRELLNKPSNHIVLEIVALQNNFSELEKRNEFLSRRLISIMKAYNVTDEDFKIMETIIEGKN